MMRILLVLSVLFAGCALSHERAALDSAVVDAEIPADSGVDSAVDSSHDASYDAGADAGSHCGNFTGRFLAQENDCGGFRFTFLRVTSYTNCEQAQVSIQLLCPDLDFAEEWTQVELRFIENRWRSSFMDIWCGDDYLACAMDWSPGSDSVNVRCEVALSCSARFRRY